LVVFAFFTAIDSARWLFPFIHSIPSADIVMLLNKRCLMSGNIEMDVKPFKKLMNRYKVKSLLQKT
ncbi:hypothetical protein WAI92_22665, partial [Acinetobacter baumannii]